MKERKFSSNEWLAIAVALCIATCARADVAKASRGAAATVHPLATEAAARTIRAGGNAVDAAVAAGLMLGVVDGFNSGIGGGCFIVARLADGRLLAIDGRETAPQAATRDMYLVDGKYDPELSQTGSKAIATPGALAAYFHASQRYGRIPIRSSLLHAAAVAENGFTIDQSYRSRLASAAKELAKFEASKEIFLTEEGAALPVGSILLQKDLASTYRNLADHGLPWFYHGPFAQRTGEWMREQGGLLEADDFARYKVGVREPVTTSYRGYTIVGFPPPSSGGIHVAQILNILENFDLKSLGAEAPATVHIIAEAMKLAFADRAHWLGDPDFADVPRGLVSKKYAKQLAARIRPGEAIEVEQHGIPEKAEENVFGRPEEEKHTTHFSVTDNEGNWVAITATVNTTFGSKVVIPGTGVPMNNEMDDFAAQPGQPNFFGLVGAEANAIAPGKRPLSSMSPTIVLKEGVPILSVGAAGGPTIITQVLLTLVYMIDFDMDVEHALAMSRFHHQWKPNEIRVESTMRPEVIAKLKEWGHTVREVRSMGATQAVARPLGAEIISGITDPRNRGKAAAW